MFAIPEGYNCVVRQSDTQLYAYRNNTIRDTYIVNGYHWEKTQTSTNTTQPNNAVCVYDPQYPSQIVGFLLLGAIIVVLCFFKIILNMIMGVRR